MINFKHILKLGSTLLGTPFTDLISMDHYTIKHTYIYIVLVVYEILFRITWLSSVIFSLAFCMYSPASGRWSYTSDKTNLCIFVCTSNKSCFTLYKKQCLKVVVDMRYNCLYILLFILNCIYLTRPP